MASTRGERLNEDIKRELISIISQMKDPRLQCFLTILRVETSPDLTNAKVYLSVLEGDEACKNAIKVLSKGQGFIRGELSRRLHIKRSPEFVFIKDDGAAYAQKINEIIRDINNDK
ncbi:MAG: 30S ribosome-binding factor RbfA [Oscillospiraceae bacterium]